jgi:hypothetical protein
VFSRISGGGDSGGASFHAPPLENLKKQGCLERLPPLFTFLPAVTPTVTCTRRKKHKPVDLTSSFLQICFWLHFSSPETILL